MTETYEEKRDRIAKGLQALRAGDECYLEWGYQLKELRKGKVVRVAHTQISAEIEYPGGPKVEKFHRLPGTNYRAGKMIGWASRPSYLLPSEYRAQYEAQEQAARKAAQAIEDEDHLKEECRRIKGDYVVWKVGAFGILHWTDEHKEHGGPRFACFEQNERGIYKRFKGGDYHFVSLGNALAYLAGQHATDAEKVGRIKWIVEGRE